MTDDLKGFHPRAFARANNEPDAIYFAKRGQDTLMDVGARTAVSALYQTTLPAMGDVLDLMCGSLSHIPPEANHDRVVGLDVSRSALDANASLTERVVQDLNTDTVLPFEDETMDAVCLCDGLAYLTQPVSVLREVWRVLKPGAPLIITFSDNFHVAKAVALWQALESEDRSRFISLLLGRAGFMEIDTGEVVPPEDLTAWHDTVHALIARKTANA
ncbi:class I SAM-dependent methyltransferase [Brytella acorum]|uniref:class I SAM-dependent methyltransferase n=1 Tax=Brytella acorum TaxID=2959299 RepID=UPI0025AE34C6|nr:class I SAM-dependent methyltransferase [Brytella acorum]MDF3624562.1 class I SAM-dependent methyltransferase [Brytella acorum]